MFDRRNLLHQVSSHLVLAVIGNIFRAKLGLGSRLKPLILTYFATFACNFSCCYCRYIGERTPEKMKSQLDTEGVYELLRIFRKTSPHVHFSGGEPLMREDIISILKKAEELRFKTVTMATNMSLMHKKMEALDYLTGIAVSLDMTDMKKYSGIIGVSESVLERMMKNIRECAELQREKHFTMTIGFVANRETLPEIYAIHASRWMP